MSGQIAPTVVGPDKDRTELYLALGVLAILGLGMTAYWFSSRSTESETRIVTNTKPDVLFGTPIQPSQDEAKVASSPIQTDRSSNLPADPFEQDIKHIDVYFEVGRKGLSDEAKAQLQPHAELLKKDSNWGVVLQGYTDQQGSAEYNRKLGLRRAPSVPTYLRHRPPLSLK
jgi:outer membrane protein OmpA-like peptidoglycan-associated protein